MNSCPSCGRLIADPAATVCPNCGASLYGPPPQYAAPADPAPTEPQHGQPYYQTPASQTPGEAPYPGAYSGPYGAPVAPSQPMYPPTQYGAYPPFPAAPSQPMYPYGGYPQGAPPPVYAQASGANWRPAQVQAKPGMPGWLIATLVIVLGAVVLSAVGFGAYALSANRGRQSPLIGASAGTATPSQGQELLNDPLTSNANGWSEDAQHCFFDSSGYHVESTDQVNYECFAPIGSIADGKITVTTEQVAGSTLQSYGISFRFNQPHTHYLFGIDSNSKWALFKVLDGDYTTLKDFAYSASIHGGLHSLNTIAVEFRGQAFTFWVNGTRLGSFTDSGSDLGSGRVGLETTGATNVVFTNFVAEP